MCSRLEIIQDIRVKDSSSFCFNSKNKKNFLCSHIWLWVAWSGMSSPQQGELALWNKFQFDMLHQTRQNLTNIHLNWHFLQGGARVAAGGSTKFEMLSSVWHTISWGRTVSLWWRLGKDEFILWEKKVSRDLALISLRIQSILTLEFVEQRMQGKGKTDGFKRFTCILEISLEEQSGHNQLSF